MELKFEEFDYNKNLNQQRILFRDSFPEVENASNDSYFWLLHGFPNNKKTSFEYASYIGDEMVGYYAAIPYRYKIGNEITDIGMVCGVMTSPNYRGKGIFTQMGKYSTEKLSYHVPFTTGYPIRKSVIPGHLKVGWKIAFKLPLYMKFVQIDSFLKNKLPKLSFIAPFINFFLKQYNLIIKTKIDRNYQVDIYNSIDEINNYNDFVNDWIKTIPNTLIKDKDFAKWRYARPKSQFKFLVIRKNDKIVGFVAYCSVIKEGVPSYCLLDLCVLPEFCNCLGLIYSILYNEAKNNNIEVIMLMISNLSAKKYKLISNGFLKSPYTFHLIIKNLTNYFSDEQLFNEENWHLMWVDSDDL